MSPCGVPQRPIVAFVAAAISAVTIGAVAVIAQSSGSGPRAAVSHPASAAPHVEPFRPASAARPVLLKRKDTVVTLASRHRLVDAAVANVWGSPHKPRRVDAPSLRQPAQLEQWLHRMTVPQRRGLTPRLSTQVRYGDDVLILRQRGAWSKVRIPSQVGGRFPTGIKGWIVTRQLATRPADWHHHATVATVTAVKTVLSWPANGVGRSLILSYATTLPVVATSADRVTVELPGTALTGSLPRPAVVVHPVGTPAIRPSGAAVVAQARRFLGLPYLWAGMSAWGFDCSGLTSTVLSQLGVDLPRDAADQSTVGRQVSRRHLRPGDLVFFSYGSRWAIHHVAIYAGHGKVIQSPFSGARVQFKSLWHSYLRKEYWGATRPLS
jgi:cell wall-associated NlpC family hydrolase